MTMEKKTKTCRQCSHRERWQCGGSVIQYCGKRKKELETEFEQL